VIADGYAYILNMCDQAATVTLNGASGSQPIPAMAASGKMPEPYAIQALAAARVPNPAPFAEFAFGSGPDKSTNVLEFYLGDDKASTRKLSISLTQNELHLGLDCQIFLFYKSAVLRFQGDARFYPANSNLYLEA
jgi:hypothetical protein